jgi:hypothetical protein
VPKPFPLHTAESSFVEVNESTLLNAIRNHAEAFLALSRS